MPRQDPLRIRKEVGRRIAELRVEHGLTQAECAERAGVSLKYWQRLEAGENPTVTTLVGLANLFNVKVATLFERPASRAVKRGRPPRRVATE